MRKGREEILRKQIHTEKQNARRSMSTGILNGRAENGTRTRDPQLGKLMLYKLSYFRKCRGKYTVFPFISSLKRAKNRR